MKIHISPLLKYSIFFLALGLIATGVLSERKQKNTGKRRNILRKDGLRILSGIKKAYKAPLLWKEKEFFIIAIIATGIGILYLYDEEINDWFQMKEKKAHPLLKDFGWYYGSPENHYAIIGGCYLYGLLTYNEPVRKTGVLLMTSSLAAGIFQTIAKIIIGRARPIRNEGKSSFCPMSRENSYYSFPSGHSILSFTTAYATGTQLNSPIFKSVIYALGSIAPVSRLWAGAHWITDAVISLSISIPLVRTIDKHLKEYRFTKV